MSDLFAQAYNPDVLSCLANLSNDEVFTPPEIANQMLDMLPEEIWSDPNATFLDPATKSGVFLREIAKRLLEARMPGYEVIMKEINKKISKGEKLSQGEQDYVDKLNAALEHIFKKQVFGIAMTELCSLLSRRSLYCSKYPNCDYAIVKFDDPEGNIRYRRKEHEWVNGRCKYCGASQENYDRGDELESYAYEFIHFDDVEEELPMKFDVIIGNPPYQLETGGSGRQAKPVYHQFVLQAIKLNPKYLVMIIPSRWFSGGMGLDSFRQAMMNDRHITQLVDYANAKECFPQNSISGGVCYFLRERDTSSDCNFINMKNGNENSCVRSLNEFSVLVRYNDAVGILRKVVSKKEESLTGIVSSISPFGITTSVRGDSFKIGDSQIRLLSSRGFSYLDNREDYENSPFYNFYKVALSQTGAEHACEPDKSGMFRVLTSSMQVLNPTDVCTHSYLAIGAFENEREANNLLSYLKTKFVRFLILQAVSSIHISKTTFCFVPLQDFTKPWTDEELYEKYGITEEERAFIDSMIRPMELDDGE